MEKQEGATESTEVKQLSTAAMNGEPKETSNELPTEQVTLTEEEKALAEKQAKGKQLRVTQDFSQIRVEPAFNGDDDKTIAPADPSEVDHSQGNFSDEEQSEEEEEDDKEAVSDDDKEQNAPAESHIQSHSSSPTQLTVETNKAQSPKRKSGQSVEAANNVKSVNLTGHKHAQIIAKKSTASGTFRVTELDDSDQTPAKQRINSKSVVNVSFSLVL